MTESDIEGRGDLAAGSPDAEVIGEWMARSGRPSSWWKEILSTVVPAIMLAVLVNLFLAQSTVVFGQSMESNLHSHQRLVIEKISYRFHGPRRGDIVVLKLPGWEGDPLIKRVVGLAGEQIEIRDGAVYIDGALLDEPYLDQETPGRMAPQVVPPFHVFVMGDNRSASNDSRYFGPVPLSSIWGRAWMSYWPLSDIKIIQ